MILIERTSENISQRALSVFVTKARQAIGLRGETAIRITSARQLQELNRSFRRKNTPTDVLSFPSSLAGAAGDIAIAREIAAGNARALGHSLNTELKVLILHGLLHLAGYDHETDDGEMTAWESRLRKELGLPLGLIERTEAVHSHSSSHAVAEKRRQGGATRHNPRKQIFRGAASPQDDKSNGWATAKLKPRPFKSAKGRPRSKAAGAASFSPAAGEKMRSKRGGHRA